MAKSFKRVGAVDNAVSILSYLASADRPLKLTEIARQLNINGSTCFNILRTLETHGLVLIDPSTKTYTVGTALLELARRSAERGSDVDLLKPMMDQIAARHGVHVSLWSRVDPDHLALIAASESNDGARISMTLGQRRPTIYGAIGRVMAAFGDIDEAYINQHFPSLRWAQPVSLETYLKQVQETRKRGWSSDKGTAAVGLQVIAAPIYGRDNRVTRAICATTFLGHLDAAQEKKLAEELMILRDVLRQPYDVKVG